MGRREEKRRHCLCGSAFAETCIAHDIQGNLFLNLQQVAFYLFFSYKQ